MGLAERPTDVWRERIRVEANDVGTGRMDPEDAVSRELYPPELMAAVDRALDAFEAEVSGLTAASDEEVVRVIRGLVIELNRIHLDFDEDAISTDGRELICDYIDQMIISAGIDLEAVAKRRGTTRRDITDEWRRW
ncbi:Uncharacterised protein [Mycobacterium tuberculosis]|nr:Uncharacterised protein [Mycobacterium tuberculosis]